MVTEQKPQEFIIEWETNTFKIGAKSWPINPQGHTLENRNKLIAIVEEYETILNSEGLKESARQKAHEKSTRATLEIAVPTLNFEETANDPNIGYGILGAAAVDLYRFLAVNGGRAGMRHFLTQFNIQPKEQSQP